MPKIVSDFYFASIQSAINCVKGTSYCCWRKKIPEVKTVVQYEVALEEAVPALIRAENDEYIIELLKDAKEHKKWPKDYESYMVKNCVIGNRKAKHGKFFIKDGLQLLIKFQYLTVKIYPSYIEVKCQNDMTKEDLTKWLTKDVLTRIVELREVLAKIQQIAES